MDIRAPGWFAQLQLSGVAKPNNYGPGTIMMLNAGILRDLQQLNPRSLSAGKTVTVVFAQTPFTDNKATQDTQLIEVSAGLQDVEAESGPDRSESFEQYYDRLRATGHTHDQAKFIANDWFDKPQDAVLESWLRDSKAIRFRQLNSSASQFENALPGEYAMLKLYVLAEYPEQVAGLTFRIA